MKRKAIGDTTDGSHFGRPLPYSHGRTLWTLAMRACVTALVLLLSIPLYACAQSAKAFSKPGIAPVSGPLFLTEYHPPEEYRAWYESMEECLGLTGDYDKVRWFAVPTPWKAAGKKNTTYAFWTDKHWIVLNSEGWRDSLLVQHEVVHDILDYHDLQPDMAHPMPYFDGTCTTEFYEGS